MDLPADPAEQVRLARSGLALDDQPDRIGGRAVNGLPDGAEEAASGVAMQAVHVKGRRAPDVVRRVGPPEPEGLQGPPFRFGHGSGSRPVPVGQRLLVRLGDEAHTGAAQQLPEGDVDLGSWRAAQQWAEIREADPGTRPRRQPRVGGPHAGLDVGCRIRPAGLLPQRAGVRVLPIRGAMLMVVARACIRCRSSGRAGVLVLPGEDVGQPQVGPVQKAPQVGQHRIHGAAVGARPGRRAGGQLARAPPPPVVGQLVRVCPADPAAVDQLQLVECQAALTTEREPGQLLELRVGDLPGLRHQGQQRRPLLDTQPFSGHVVPLHAPSRPGA